MTLAADKFIRRFLLHTLPAGFHRIRHLGFLANGHRTDKLALCRALLAVPPPEPPPPQSYRERYRRVTGEALDVCPDCGGPCRSVGHCPSSAVAAPILVRQLMTSEHRRQQTRRAARPVSASAQQDVGQ
jgi:hypothetical protein